MSDERRGDWIETYLGRKVYPLDLRAEDVHLFDIAHSLANMCRFTGHVSRFWSVAQHSVMVSHLCESEGCAMWGLLHDASEAYLVDIPAPLKRMPEFVFYRDAEERAMRVIAERFGLAWPEPPAVRHADLLMLSTEATWLLNRREDGWFGLPDPLPDPLEPMTPEVAEKAFLSRFLEIRCDEHPGW